MKIIPATLAHADQLAANLRPEDLRELNSIEPNTHLPSRLARAVGLSVGAAFAAVAQEGLVCVGGVAPRGDGSGSVWLMGTRLMDRHRLALGRITPACIQLMHQDYRLIHNTVDPRNAAHIRWLRWAGFKRLAAANEVVADGTVFHTYFRHQP